MSDFLHRLADRAAGRVATVQPRLPALFEPATAGPRFDLADQGPLTNPGLGLRGPERGLVGDDAVTGRVWAGPAAVGSQFDGVGRVPVVPDAGFGRGRGHGPVGDDAVTGRVWAGPAAVGPQFDGVGRAPGVPESEGGLVGEGPGAGRVRVGPAEAGPARPTALRPESADDAVTPTAAAPPGPPGGRRRGTGDRPDMPARATVEPTSVVPAPVSAEDPPSPGTAAPVVTESVAAAPVSRSTLTDQPAIMVRSTEATRPAGGPTRTGDRRGPAPAEPAATAFREPVPQFTRATGRMDVEPAASPPPEPPPGLPQIPSAGTASRAPGHPNTVVRVAPDAPAAGAVFERLAERAVPPASAVVPASTAAPRPDVARRQLSGQTQDAPASAAPTIHVTIGRVEVRASTPAPAVQRPRSQPPPASSLENYLRRRARGGTQ
jgi:hypothetical protein